jgi:adenylate cyclase
MGVETERKFLVTDESWREQAHETRTLRQGYLAIDGSTIVRVRTDGKAAWVTIKGGQEGLTRPEFEYSVPAEDAEALLALCGGRLVEKIRHLVRFGGKLWEVDQFMGANEGLVVAEVELSGADEAFSRPNWLGAEVSGDPRYLNANLSLRPYTGWVP